LQEIAAAWRRWAEHPDGWFALLHGEILCRAGGQGRSRTRPKA
jgi:hypothetical protein